MQSKRSWIKSTCDHCPFTTSLLKEIPNVRTALFSRLGAGTKLGLHTGWEDLANYVLRCHLALRVPSAGSCGLYVSGEVRLHVQDEIIVFDDSKTHKAFNESCEDRIVLIVDILRPDYIPKGIAKGGHTKELDSFISQFR
jgi:aspartyl/asparaginyl beta-hydroxylase (cupin superfamily)